MFLPTLKTHRGFSAYKIQFNSNHLKSIRNVHQHAEPTSTSIMRQLIWQSVPFLSRYRARYKLIISFTESSIQYIFSPTESGVHRRPNCTEMKNIHSNTLKVVLTICRSSKAMSWYYLPGIIKSHTWYWMSHMILTNNLDFGNDYKSPLSLLCKFITVQFVRIAYAYDNFA